MPQLIGIFGGSFDPIHKGHVDSVGLLDQVLREQKVTFERIHWVLSARPPHKEQLSASVEHRFAMLELALKRYSRYVVDDVEVKRKEKSYTIDTIRHFQQKYPKAYLNLIIGADSLVNLHTWSNYEELINSVNLLVLNRPGYKCDVPEYLSDRILLSSTQLCKFKAGKLVLLSSSAFDVSSTVLRQALGQKEPNVIDQGLVSNFLDQSVLEYIHRHGLYKNTI